MTSAKYYVTIYNKIFRMKQGSNISRKFNDMFLYMEYRMNNPYGETPIDIIIRKEQSPCDEEYLIFTQLNSTYRAMIEFQRDKGFDNKKYKGKIKLS